MKKKRIAIFLAILGLLLPCVIRSPASSAEGPKRVAILPFIIHAQRDLTFLQEGIMDMLASRLAWKGEVEILEKGLVKKQAAQLEGPMDKEKALNIGKALQADYVIMGSLTVFGESVSMDARILDVLSSEELISAFNQSKGMDEVIPTVNQFALDINSKIMGRQLAPPRYALAPGEREEPEGPPGLIKLKEDLWEREPEKIIRLKVGILGMDIGDVDGDGQKEMVCIDNKTLYIYKWREGTLVQFRKIEGRWSPAYVWVDVADLNGNGRDEIYITNLTSSSVSSLILEWQGNRLATLASGLRWFLRIVKHPVEGPILIGQKRAMSKGFAGDIHRLKMEKDRVVDAGRLEMPRPKMRYEAGIYSFAMGDIAGQGKPHTVLLSKSDYLWLFDENGQRIWQSSEKFGGSLLYMIDNESMAEIIHFTPRILLTDMDADGKVEVAVCKNLEATGRILENMQFFKSGELYFFTWDGVGLSPGMKSIKLSGAVTDYQIGDVDNDGQMELVIVSVMEGWRLWGRTGRSTVVVLDLEV